VKSAQYHLRRSLGDSTATNKESSTSLLEVEAQSNSQTTNFLSNNLHNTFLHPEQLFIEQPLTQLPSIDYTPIQTSRLTKWKALHFPPQGVANSRTLTNNMNFKPGRDGISSSNVRVHGVTILHEDNTASPHRPTGNTEVHPSSNGKV
jgi:hypothetical protein